MRRLVPLWLGVLAALLSVSGPARATAPGAADLGDALSRFEKAEPGWRARVEALVLVARAGPKAVPSLIEALGSHSLPLREFAAHALAFVGDARSAPALRRALADPDKAVRINAIRALSALGSVELSAEERKVLESSPAHWWGPMYVSAALARTDPRDPQVLRKLLAGYDFAGMASARTGSLAPDFSLTDASGRPYRLSQFRDRSMVVLEFESGDG